MRKVYLPRGDRRHGYNGYCNLGCRCDVCRAATAAYTKAMRQVRARRIALDPSVVEHGKESTYFNWSCRCTPCTKAQRVAAAARRKDRAA